LFGVSRPEPLKVAVTPVEEIADIGTNARDLWFQKTQSVRQLKQASSKTQNESKTDEQTGDARDVAVRESAAH
jgi:hypothetical protein